MSLLTLPFKWPFMPLRAVIRLGQVIEAETERQMANPAKVESELEIIEQAERSGQISGEKAADLETQAVTGYTQARKAVAAPAYRDEG